MILRNLKWWGIAGIVLLLAGLPIILPTYAMFVLTSILIFAVFAMSLDILIGFMGYTSFGHAAYFAVGAYVAIITSIRIGQNLLLNSSLALLAVLVTALIFGAVALRTTGLIFIMITLALGQAVWGLAYRWASVTGGDNGISGLKRPILPVVGQLSDPYAFYYFVLIIFALVTGILLLVTRSPLGLSWQGIRDSEARMKALGYNVWLHKYIAYVVSALFGGVAGILNAYLTGFVSPEAAFLSNSATAILMVILGGKGTLVGAILGATVVILMRQVVSSFTERWVLVLGLVYIGTVMYIPGGLLGLLRRLVARLSRDRPDAQLAKPVQDRPAEPEPETERV